MQHYAYVHDLHIYIFTTFHFRFFKILALVTVPCVDGIKRVVFHWKLVLLLWLGSCSGGACHYRTRDTEVHILKLQRLSLQSLRIMSILERIRIQSNVDLDPSSDGGSLIFYLFIDLFLQIRQYRDNTIYLSSSSTFF